MTQPEFARVQALSAEIARLHDHLSALDRERADVEGMLSRLQQERDDQILYINPCPQRPMDRIMEITGDHHVLIEANQAESSRRR